MSMFLHVCSILYTISDNKNIHDIAKLYFFSVINNSHLLKRVSFYSTELESFW